MKKNNLSGLDSDIIRQISAFFDDKYQDLETGVHYLNCGGCGAGCCSAATDCGNDSMNDCGAD